MDLSSLNQRQKGDAYVQLLADALASPTPEIRGKVNQVVSDIVTQDHVGLVVARQVLTELASRLPTAITDAEVHKDILRDTLEIVQPRLVSFEEQLTTLRMQLAQQLEDEEDFKEAARVLMALSLDSGHRVVSDEEKFSIYVRIVRLLLEEEDSVQAETYHNRAALLVHSPGIPRSLALAYKLCAARIADYARKFDQAALRFHELSWVADLDEGERTQALGAAITCAVLAPAGPNRSRVLAALCRDERSAQLPNHTILTKMFLGRILRPAEVADFEKSLQSHQLAKVAPSANDRLQQQQQSASEDEREEPGTSRRTGPSTVLDRAVLEHNLLSCSNIYNNISFNSLGALLDLTPAAAETMARRMIEEGRLRGHIDQVERLIWFEPPEEEDAQGKAGGLGNVDLNTEDTGAPLTKKWDKQIHLTAASVEYIVQHLAERGLVKLPEIAA